MISLSNQLVRSISLALVLCGSWGVCADETEHGPRYSEPQIVIYEFGLEITSHGEATDILGTVPIPIDWPEQKVSIIAKNKSQNLNRISFKDLGREARQMILKANRIGASELARGTITMQIAKRMVLPPQDPSQLQFAPWIPNDVKKFLKPSPYIESNHPLIRETAGSIEIDDSATAWEQVETIYRWVREKIAYEFDEQIHSTLDALRAGKGDCEELSSVFVAICRARGIPARAVWIPTHTYPEFYMADRQGQGYWFPCQIAGDYEFGAMSELKPILQKGDRFKLPGNPQVLRYIQPTLVAKNASAGISIQFIAQEIPNHTELAPENLSKSLP